MGVPWLGTAAATWVLDVKARLVLGVATSARVNRYPNSTGLVSGSHGRTVPPVPFQGVIAAMLLHDLRV